MKLNLHDEMLLRRISIVIEKCGDDPLKLRECALMLATSYVNARVAARHFADKVGSAPER